MVRATASCPRFALAVVAVTAGCVSTAHDWRPELRRTACVARSYVWPDPDLVYYEPDGRVASALLHPDQWTVARERFHYDAQQRLVEIIALVSTGDHDLGCENIGGCASGATRTIERVRVDYGPSGQVSQVAHAIDRYQWDPSPRPAWRRDDSGEHRATSSYRYDPRGRLARVDAVGRRTELIYDGDRLVQIWTDTPEPPLTSGPSTTELGYDAEGRVAEIRRPGRPPQTVRYDRGRPIDIDNQVWHYDDQGRVVAVTGSALADNTPAYEYDALGRVVAITTEDSDGRRVRSVVSYSAACGALPAAQPVPPPLLAKLGAVVCVTAPVGRYRFCP